MLRETPKPWFRVVCSALCSEWPGGEAPRRIMLARLRGTNETTDLGGGHPSARQPEICFTAGAGWAWAILLENRLPHAGGPSRSPVTLSLLESPGRGSVFWGDRTFGANLGGRPTIH